MNKRTFWTLLAGILAIAIIAIGCTPKSSGTAQYDYDKILDGNLSDFAGTWVNGDGRRIELTSNGSFGGGGDIYGYHKADDGIYKWTVSYDDGGFGVNLYPAGVEVHGLVNRGDYWEEGIIPTDTTKVRIIQIQGDSIHGSNAVFYRETTAVQTQSSQTGLSTESHDLPKIMYVNAPDGLRVRSSPDINGERVGLLPHLAVIDVINEEMEDVTIGNIRGRWALMQYRTRVGTAFGHEPLVGWVFNGYLNDWSQNGYQNHLNTIDMDSNFQTDDAQKIIGTWSPGIDWFRYIYSADGRYSSALLETSFGTSGTWRVNDDVLILSEIERGDYETEINDPPLRYAFTFLVIGNDTLLLRSIDQEDTSTKIFFKVGQ